MPTIPLPSYNISGYTGLNVYGSQSMMTEILTAQTLAAGDVVLSDAQARTIGIIEVTTGHATNSFVLPNLPGAMYYIVNSDATLAAGIKVLGGSAVTVAATKTALIYITSAGATKKLTADA
ncbi:hypothetical protein D3C73_845690 [compost metagenome]